MRRGLSLIETMVYISVLLSVILLFVNLLLSISRSYISIRMIRMLDSAAAVSMDRMAREVRLASDIDVSSILGTNPGGLVLKKSDSLGVITQVAFIVSDSQLHIVIDGVDDGSLFPTGVTITNLVFRQIDSGASKAVKIEMALEYKDGGIVRTQNYYSTIILRGTYLND